MALCRRGFAVVKEHRAPNFFGGLGKFFVRNGSDPIFGGRFQIADFSQHQAQALYPLGLRIGNNFNFLTVGSCHYVFVPRQKHVHFAAKGGIETFHFFVRDRTGHIICVADNANAVHRIVLFFIIVKKLDGGI